MSETHRLSVVIVTYNSAATIAACIASVPSDAEAILVDQQSSDESVDIAKAVRPDVSVVMPGANRGFGAGCNLGAANASREFVAFLNPDAQFVDGAADIVCRTLLARRALVGTTLLDSEGSVITRARRRSSAITDLLDLVLPQQLIPRGLRRDIPATSPVYSSGGPVGYIQGACMVLRRDDFWSVGGFDEVFFLYGEEEYLAERLGRVGVPAYLEPAAVVRHQGAVSTSGVRAFSVRQYHRSRAIHYAKEHGTAGGLMRSLGLATGLLGLLVTAPLRRRLGYRKLENAQFCRAGLMGLVDGVVRRVVTAPSAHG